MLNQEKRHTIGLGLICPHWISYLNSVCYVLQQFVGLVNLKRLAQKRKLKIAKLFGID